MVFDIFIAKKKNKLVQMFPFVRFIRVVDQVNLVKSLCSIRIGCLIVDANLARFSHVGGKPMAVKKLIFDRPGNRASMAKSSYVKVLTCDHAIVAKDVKLKVIPSPSSVPSDDGNSLSFLLALLGCYKEFRAICNSRIMCHGEEFLDVELV